MTGATPPGDGVGAGQSSAAVGDAHADDRHRRRLRMILFVAVGFMTTGFLASATVATLAARDIMGSELLSGLPSAVAVIATAVGTTVLGRVVVAAGRRRSLIVGTLVATGGSIVAAVGVFERSLLVLLIGTALLGFGYAASHLSRYTAAELVAPAHRGTAVSLIVWAGTIGAVVGPRLVGPAGSAVESMGRIAYGGGYVAAAVAWGLAALVVVVGLRPDPTSVALVELDVAGHDGGATASVAGAFRMPGVQVALVGMVIGQFVMVLIMTSTPIHVEDQGFGLATVGGILSAHTLGMFAFAPVVGWVVDRAGPRPMIAASAAVLALSGVMAALAPTGATGQLTAALFLLGIGWNLSFVAGSTLLSVSVQPSVRPLVQGRVDSVVWTTSAIANLASGVLLAGPGYTPTAWLGAALAVVTVVVLRARPQRRVASV